MNQIKLLLLFFIAIFSSFKNYTCAQTFDTKIDVGNGYQLDFTIIKGKGSPILFESGFGIEKDEWKNIITHIANVTDATIITYNRLTYSNNLKSFLIPFDTEIKALEIGLSKLGYANKDIMLVAHSLGGMYCSYYAYKHPTNIKAAVFIDDANVCSLKAYNNLKNKANTDTLENYFANVLQSVEQKPMPLYIPLIDIVADTHFDKLGNLDTVWLSCHKKFVALSPSRQLLLAYNVGHIIYAENPPLIINTIIKQYANFLAPKQKAIILEKGSALAINLSNETKKNEVKCGHSEEDINTWGYSYIEKNEIDKAIEVFKLNVMLNPKSWNSYDSLGEAYLKAGDKNLAKKNYKKSLELNSTNEDAKKILEQLK